MNVKVFCVATSKTEKVRVILVSGIHNDNFLKEQKMSSGNIWGALTLMGDVKP